MSPAPPERVRRARPVRLVITLHRITTPFLEPPARQAPRRRVTAPQPPASADRSARPQLPGWLASAHPPSIGPPIRTLTPPALLEPAPESQAAPAEAAPMAPAAAPAPPA